MKTFFCDSCGGLVFFENVSCLKCGHALGFLPDVLDLSALEPAGRRTVRALSKPARDRRFRLCANSVQHGVCNWLIPEDDPHDFCAACRLNDLIPDLGIDGNLTRWHRLELAKRRLLYTLLKLRLPIDAVPGENRPALRFRFLADTFDETYLTGHVDGVVTINIAEADDEVRERQRIDLREPLRTLLGHFRHEIAHYYWDRLIWHSEHAKGFRQLFGSENADYATALDRHYRRGPRANWAARHVSAYASVHPWEDWAETTAHYFHITDTIETAAGFGITLRPRHPAAEVMTADARRAGHPTAGFDEMMAAWFPLTYALNALNRGMGLPDLYPFVLSDSVIEKLRFVHEVFTTAARPPDSAA